MWKISAVAIMFFFAVLLGGNPGDQVDSGSNSTKVNTEINQDRQDEYHISEDNAMLTMSSSDGYLSDGATMSLVSNTKTDIEVSIVNDSGTDIVYGSDFVIEQLVNGAWTALAYTNGLKPIFTYVGYEVPTGTKSSWSTNFEWAYGSLPSGQYRMIKEILFVQSQDDYSKDCIFVEFSV